MIYQPRAWGHWIQANVYEQFALYRLVAMFLAVILAPQTTKQPSPCAGLAQQLSEAHGLLDKLGVTKYHPTSGAEWSLPVRINVLARDVARSKR